jgi:hypothetical protein
MPTLGSDADCVTKDVDYQRKRGGVLSFLRQLPDRSGVEVIMFDTALRAGQGYMPIADDKILYIANGHLSYEGSIFLAHKMNLRERIHQAAK